MKTRLLVLVVLAFGLQGIAEAKNPEETETSVERALSGAGAQDEVWGIGRRAVAQAQTSPYALAQPDTDAIALADLETAFWVCDYIATTRGVEATPIALCGAVYDELKTVKFSGDFSALLHWWKQNKRVEHLKIAGELPDGAVERIGIRY